MEFEVTYGQGQYREHKDNHVNLHGQIILGEYRVHLRSHAGDISQSYIVLDKIISMQLKGNELEFHVRPHAAYRYVASISGDKKNIRELAKEIVKKRKLKKKFLRNFWVDRSL